MEYSCSSWNEDTFVLEFSDDEYDTMDGTDKYGDKEQTRRVNKRHDNSLVLHDYNAKLQLENYSDFKDLSLRQIQESENATLPNYSPEKPQTTSTNIKKDVMVNIPKLIYQLLNAKVVIEKMYESSGKDLISETKCVLPEGSQLKDSIQRYCPECETLKTDKLGVKLVKFCQKCGTTLKYLCSKCNIKRYSHYGTLRLHWKECGQTGNDTFNGSQFQDFVQRYCSKCKMLDNDKNGVTTEKFCSRCETPLKYACSKCNKKEYRLYESLKRHWNKCGLTAARPQKFNPSDFLVKKTNIVYSREIIRYCSRCNKIEENCPKCKEEVCQNCNYHLLYQCNKCKATYTTYTGVKYHLQSQCYPSQYKCNQCDFITSTWSGMCFHVDNMHYCTKINCPRCDRLFRKRCIRLHLKYCGSKAKFNCNDCAFKTKYKYSLKKHIKTIHGN